METKQKQKQSKERNSRPIDVGDSVVAIASGERKKKNIGDGGGLCSLIFIFLGNMKALLIAQSDQTCAA